MSLSYIITQVGYKLGISPSNSGERTTLLRYINSAAKEVYQTSDMAGSLNEMVLNVNPDQCIALPWYVGQVRAMRNPLSRLPVNLSQQRPLYNMFSWGDQEWNNWRLKGLSPILQSIKNQAQVTVTTPVVEDPPAVVTITGPTVNASVTTETITLSSTSVQTVNAFLDIVSFTKSTVNTVDISLYDVDGNQLAVIPNNRLSSQYQIIDVSHAPWWGSNVSSQYLRIQVLYKKALTELSNDSDEFPAVGYDDVVVNKALQLYAEDTKNPELAMAYQAKCTNLLAQIHEDANRGTNDTVSIAAHPHDRINPRVGQGRDWRYAWRMQGR